MLPNNAQAPLPRVVEIARDLIRFDTTNFGLGKSNGESEAARYIQNLFTNIGLASEIFDSAPGRSSLIARVKGTDPSLPALVVHGHLDVVPAEAADWQHPPFSGEIHEGYLWGRGAVDMKNMDAMIIASLEAMAAQNIQPKRDLIIAFFADEEDGGGLGSHYLVREHPELFAGAAEAISEVGGYSVQMAQKTVYLIQTGEKAMLWLNLKVSGKAGHGSVLNDDNAITKLAEALLRLNQAHWPITLTHSTEHLLKAIAELYEKDFEQSDPRDLAKLTAGAEKFVSATLQTTVNPTGLVSGYKHNVVPGSAIAWLDVRTLPGQEEEVLAELQSIVGPEFEFEIVRRDVGLESPFSGTLVDAMVASLKKHDPEALVLPYLLSGGTDNKALSLLGIRGFGFVPLKLPEGFDFPSMFHGVDERVPIDSLVLGEQILFELLTSY
ncbi:MAG: M20/M25/M40 family metallo-hydrolase [Microbacteriaceae bacterium]